MKKLLVVAVVALLVLALVACGGDETPTTTKGGDNGVVTTPAVTTPKTEAPETTAPKGNVTTAPGTTVKVPGGSIVTPPTTAPETSAKFPGVDILNGDPADMAINPTWQGMNAGAFENHHASLDMNWAYVLLFQECENAIYEDLIMTYPDEEGNDTWMMNEDYEWVLTLNGEDITIERFSIYHNVTSGYVRLDLGEDFELAAEKEDGTIDYEIVLRINDITGDTPEPKYFAYLTDPDWNGTHNFTAPAPIKMVEDENRDPEETVIPGATPFTGPAGFTGELYENLFDEGKNGEIINVQTKLCCGEDLTTPIVWKYDEAVYVTSYSLVGAGDDATYYDRIVTTFKFYGSTNGTDWTLLDEQNGEAATEGVNFAERNFKLAKAAEYTYFKLEPVATSTYQLSGILLWTKE